MVERSLSFSVVSVFFVVVVVVDVVVVVVTVAVVVDVETSIIKIVGVVSNLIYFNFLKFYSV